MFKKFLLAIIPVSSYLAMASAGTLQNNIVEVLHTNPVVQERLKNFRATQQDMNIAEAGYYPEVNLRLSGGLNVSGRLKNYGSSDDFEHSVPNNEYLNYESSLTLTQNLFNGFGTIYQIEFEESQVLAAAYKYLEVSNDEAFKMVDAYLNVLRTNELVETAKDNVEIDEGIYVKVQALFDSGLTTDSEVKKIQATLSLARSNLIVVTNNARDAEYQYRKILGRLPIITEMVKPELDVKMPQTIERAALYAIEHNPSLLVSKYNIKGAESLYKQRQKDYYPKVDMELSQAFNDHDDTGNGFDQADDRFKARVVMTYNLFRGGADKANVQKHISKIAQEVEIQRELKRQVVEGLDLSWNAYFMVENQLKDLRDYSQFSEKTLELYKEEYDLGRRSLLDLLSAQNDVINSRSQIIKAEYDQLFAKYRLLDAMGLLVVAVNGTADEFTSKVNINADAKAHEILDTLPIELDVDKDKITDNVDLCDNSLKENNIMPYGCKMVLRDDDKDGVINQTDECPKTPKGVKVDIVGCCIDRDADGICDYKDECPGTPLGLKVNDVGCPISKTLRLNFELDSAKILDDSIEKVLIFAEFLEESSAYKADIVGHTDSSASEEYNMKLSIARATSVQEALIKAGIDASRLRVFGEGELKPIESNKTDEGRAMNRRIEVKLYN